MEESKVDTERGIVGFVCFFAYVEARIKYKIK